MNATFQNLLKHASRLTQTGRLAEATRAIQQALRRVAGTGAAPVPAPLFRRPAAAHPATSPATTATVLDGCVFERPRDGEASAEAQVDSGSAISAISAFSSGSHSHAGMTRAYKLYTPPGAAGQALPLVVMLHGCTQNPDDFAAGTGMNELAREQGFCVLYPAQSQDANAHRCWNWFKHNHQRRGSGEAALIASMTQVVLSAQGLDGRRVYIAGLSAGGAMAALVAAAYPEVYAAVGVHSGLAPGAASSLPEALAAMRGGAAGAGLDSLPGLASAAGLTGLSGLPGLGGAGRPTPGRAAAQPAAATLAVPTIAFHGDQDATVHPCNGEQVIQAALAGSSAGAPSVPVSEPGVSPNGRRHTRTVHRSAQGQPLAEHWLLHGAGHAWSGGSAQGSYTDASGPDASREMWRFFEAQTAAARA